MKVGTDEWRRHRDSLPRKHVADVGFLCKSGRHDICSGRWNGTLHEHGGGGNEEWHVLGTCICDCHKKGDKP